MFNDMKGSRYINIRWVLASPGPITESDVELASTCPKDQRVMVLGFNTTVSEKVMVLARQRAVEVKNFKVIYELFQTVVAALTDEIGQEEKHVQEVDTDQECGCCVQGWDKFEPGDELRAYDVRMVSPELVVKANKSGNSTKASQT